MTMILTLVWLTVSAQGPSSSALTSVAGVYEMKGAIEHDSCRADAPPASMFAVVVHAPGGRSVVIELGGPPSPRYYVGRLEAGGEVAIASADGATLSEGRFSAASVTILVTQSGVSAGQPCQTATRWRGTRHGAANVFGRLVAEDDADAVHAGLSGAYLIRKTVKSDSCRPVPATLDVMMSPGAIVRVAGAPVFTLSDHGTRNLTGRLAGSAWSIDTERGMVMEKIQATDVFSAVSLTATGLAFTVTTDLSANPLREGGGACRLVTEWAAERMGTPARLHQPLTKDP